MGEHSAEIMQMARQLAADHLRERNPEALMVDNIRAGNCDGFFGVTIAAEAIAKVSELAAVQAEYIGSDYGMDNAGWFDCTETVALQLRSFLHLGNEPCP